MSKHFLLDTDASGFGIGAVLSQVTDGKEVVIAYFSKALSFDELFISFWSCLLQ
jgi:hypothetical protein